MGFTFLARNRYITDEICVVFSWEVWFVFLGLHYLHRFTSFEIGELSKTSFILPFFNNTNDLTIHRNQFYYVTQTWLDFINNTVLVPPNYNNTFWGFAFLQ